jgi:hypothetical protein
MSRRWESSSVNGVCQVETTISSILDAIRGIQKLNSPKVVWTNGEGRVNGGFRVKFGRGGRVEFRPMSAGLKDAVPVQARNAEPKSRGRRTVPAAMETCGFQDCATAGVFRSSAPFEEHRRGRGLEQGAGMVQRLWRVVGGVEKRGQAVGGRRWAWRWRCEGGVRRPEIRRGRDATMRRAGRC